MDKLRCHLEGVQGGLGAEGLHTEDLASSCVGVPKDEIDVAHTAPREGRVLAEWHCIEDLAGKIVADTVRYVLSLGQDGPLAAAKELDELDCVAGDDPRISQLLKVCFGDIHHQVIEAEDLFRAGARNGYNTFTLSLRRGG